MRPGLEFDWQIDIYARVCRALRAHLTRTIYSDKQGEPPVRTWGQDVAAWALELDGFWRTVCSYGS